MGWNAVKKMFKKPTPEESELPAGVEEAVTETIQTAREVAKTLRRQREQELFNSLLPKGHPK